VLQGKRHYIHEVTRYTKMHVRYNVLLSGNPLVPEVPDIAAFTVRGVRN
jgi:hypothetical protein